jgi:hypothetical protein
MKIRLLLFLCLLTGRAIQAQVIDITGTWTMYEMTWTSGQDINKTTEDQIKDQGMITDYFFMPEGKFKLISNMTGSGNMETAEGNWKLEGDKLTCSVKIGEDLVDIVWDFELKDGVINLKRTSPDGSISVVNSYKRK